MSDDAERKQRFINNRKKWEEKRLDALRVSLETFVGRTISFDVTSSSDQLAPRILARVVAVRGDDVEVIDMGDASVPPNEKPHRTIGLGQIRDWRAT